jgi:tight adherence protein B
MNPTTILIIGGVIAFVLLVIGLIITATEERSLVDERLEYLDEQGVAVIPKKAIIGDWVGKQATRYSWGQSLTRSLARADIKMKTGEFILLTIVFMIVGGLLGWFLGGGTKVGDGGSTIQILANIPGILIGAVVGFIAPTIYLKRQQQQRLVKFDNQLADMLNLMVNGLRAGYSIMQAMEAVSKELPPPISDEFRRVVQEMQLGIPMEVALENITHRIPSKDLDFRYHFTYDPGTCTSKR